MIHRFFIKGQDWCRPHWRDSRQTVVDLSHLQNGLGTHSITDNHAWEKFNKPRHAGRFRAEPLEKDFRSNAFADSHRRPRTMAVYGSAEEPVPSPLPRVFVDLLVVIDDPGQDEKIIRQPVEIDPDPFGNIMVRPVSG